MAIESGTYTTFAQIGIREDLKDIIYDISPVETPILSSLEKVKATATLHEWQTDALAPAGQNAAIEGDQSSFTTPTPTVRERNTLQISKKQIQVTATAIAVNTAGRKSEMAYQLVQNQRALVRDLETILTGNYPRVAGGTGTARQLRSMCAWYTTNAFRGSGGANGGDLTAATDGTQRPLTESLLRQAIQAAWTQGGKPDIILCGPFNKQVISSFAGNQSRITDTSKSRVLDVAIDIYKSDFGTYKVVADRYSRDRDVHVIETDKWGVAYLREMVVEDLAKTADSERAHVLVEYTLEARNEKSSAIIADLTTT